MTDKIFTGVIYGPSDPRTTYGWEDGPPDDPRTSLAFDRQKLNLTWLVFPEIDEEGLAILTDEYVGSIHSCFDKRTREMLTCPPLEFMRYWEKIDDGRLGLTEFMPGNHLSVMRLRARAAHERLYGVRKEGDNIYRVNFRKVG